MGYLLKILATVRLSVDRHGKGRLQNRHGSRQQDRKIGDRQNVGEKANLCLICEDFPKGQKHRFV